MFQAMKSNIAKLLVGCMMVSTFASGSLGIASASAATTLSDVSDSYASKEIQALVDAGVVSGFDDGTFKPRQSMTRAELAKIIVLSNGLKEDLEAAASFQDVNPTAWYSGYVGALVKAGITSGTSDTTFSPDAKVTREELVVFFIRALGLNEAAANTPVEAIFTDMDSVSVWAKGAVSLAYKIGFINGVDNGSGGLRFGPKESAERQALAKLAYEFKSNKDKLVEKAKEAAKVSQPDSTTTPSQTPAATSDSGSGSSSGSSKRDHKHSVATIASIADIVATVAVNGSYTLPATIQVTLSNGETRQDAVTWNPSIAPDTSRSGIYTYEGTVSGYAQTVKLTLHVEAPLAVSTPVATDKALAFAGGITLDLTALAGMLTEGTVTVTSIDASTTPTVSGISVAGQIINFDFGSTDINSLIASSANGYVEIALPIAEGVDPATVAAYYWNGETWEYQPSTVINGVVIAKVSHFSTYGVLKDTTAPTKPSVEFAIDSNTVKIHMNSEDASGIKKYVIYRDGIVIAEPSEDSFTDSGLTKGQTYNYSVKAVDPLGNTSESSDTAKAIIILTVDSISLDKTTVTFNKVGDTETLNAIIQPANSNEGIVWNSTNPYVAKVDENGLVTAVAPGSATISTRAATNGTVRAEAIVTVLGENGFTVTPTNVDYILAPTEERKFDMDVNIKPDAKISKLDVVFAFDTTGSMGGSIDTVKSNAIKIMNEIRETVPDANFGVVSFRDYPNIYTGSTDQPFYLNQTVTGDPELVTSSVNKLYAYDGGDWPESYTRALYELSDMAERSDFVGWRTDAKKLVVLFGDAPTHDTDFAGFNFGADPGRDGVIGTADDLDFEMVVQKVRDAGTIVLAVQSGNDTTAAATMKGMSIGYAGAAGTNGSYSLLESVEDIPAIIRKFAATEGNVIHTLSVNVSSPVYDSWVHVVTQAVYTNVPVTAATYQFGIQIVPPSGTAAGNYEFNIQALADGIILGQTVVKLTVQEVAVSSVTIDSNSVTLDPEQTQLLNATIHPATANNQKVSWTSSNPEVASVTSDPTNSLQATVHAKNAGTAMITVTTDDGGKFETSIVTVRDIVAPTVTGVTYSLIANGVILSWDAAVDNVATVGYAVYKNGTSVGTTDNLSLEVGSLAPGTYSFGVKAFDAAGNYSALAAKDAVILAPLSVTLSVYNVSTATNESVTGTVYGSLDKVSGSYVIPSDKDSQYFVVKFSDSLSIDHLAGKLQVSHAAFNVTDVTYSVYNDVYLVIKPSAPIGHGDNLDFVINGLFVTDDDGQVYEADPVTISLHQE
ncbi:S-layer homology domain-containing protein [Paenibacillus sp. TAB 01]|uniref:S-layer homology domain-containing protein n=1 Tax=Paenibacillus sp. TAB 01 TaxID=3368988 RepID=UPI003751CD0D